MLWGQGHRGETNFLVASRLQLSQETTNEVTGKRTPPVNLLTVSVPVQFQITNLLDWAYNNEDAPALLEDLGTREVVRYLVGVDMNDIMSVGRETATRALQERIQAAADQHKLGARIVAVDMGDLHPPVKVAPEYEKVVAAIQTKQAKILAARADDIRTNALAGAQATNISEQGQRRAHWRARSARWPRPPCLPTKSPPMKRRRRFIRSGRICRPSPGPPPTRANIFCSPPIPTTCCSSTCRNPSRRACLT